MTDLPEGWYDDGSGRLRWWTGLAWSEQVQTVQGAATLVAPAAPAAAAVPPAAPKRMPKWPFVLGGAILLLVIVGIGGVVLIAFSITNLMTAPGTPGAAVTAFNQAIENDDCDLFTAVTSDEFRLDSGIDDCADFSEGVASAREAGEIRTVTVIGFSSRNSDATVNTREALRVEVGEDDDEVVRHYTMRAVDGDWQVTGITTD